MMVGYARKLENADWKENIITNPPEEEKQELEEQSKFIKELKAEIVELVEDGRNSREEIMEELDKPEHFVEQCLEDLKSEGVLEVVDNA